MIDGMASAPYLPRLADEPLRELLQDLPAVMLTGPRAAGKTTLARRHAASVLHLDEPSAAGAVGADPDAALRRMAEPVLIDEWQEVPEVLGAVKRAVDEDPRPGRFILTGSVEADLTSATWPGTGRVVRQVLHGLTEREVRGSVAGPGLVDRMLVGDLSAVSVPPDAPDLDGYLDLALRSGFPEPALRLRPRARAAWLSSYLDQVVTRDIAPRLSRDPVRMRRYFEVLSLSTAGLPADNTLAEASGLDRRTIDGYDRLLSNLYLLDIVPAWSSNRLARLIERPKRYIVDPALAIAAARLDLETVLNDGDLRGRIIDTLVLAQLRPELEVSPRRPRVHHLRDKNGRHEIDIVLDLGRGRVMGLEVKAAATPTLKDARHLRWMRDELGDAFVRGVVLHTGPLPFELDDRIWALPIACFWGENAGAARA